MALSAAAARHAQSLMARYATLLLAAAEVYATRGDITRAILALRRLAAAQPTYEEAQARLIRLYAALGNRYDARRQYQILRDTLQRERDSEPDAALRHIYSELSAGDNGSDGSDTSDEAQTRHAVPTPVDSGHGVRVPLLAFSSAFVGRQQELSDVQRLLAAYSLVTLTGAGGVGKTRLALESARMLSERESSTYLVSLGAIGDAGLVAQAVAAVLGVREEASRPREELLAEAIGDRSVLLVLDNCEHVRATCVALMRVLLRRCPRLRILTTSRHLLSVRGEHVYAVPTLTLPDLEQLPPFELIERYDAVQLFTLRAREARADFALTRENAAAVAEICCRLDGIPLALELAAVRCRMLTTAEIARRLDDCFAVLGDHPRGVTRQRTMETALTWSYNLLTPQEQLLWARLTVFQGGWTLEAAEAVCSGGAIERRKVLGLLGQLVDHSLVLAERSDDGTRFRMLEPIRQYAERRLRATGEAEGVRRRHAAWAVALAEEAEPRLTGPEQQRWMGRLDDERDNLRAALGWALQTEAVETGLRLATSLERYWWVRGMLGEGRSWHDRLLGLARGVPDMPERLLASAFYGSGWLACQQGDFAVAEERATEALRLCAWLGNPARETVGAMSVLSELAYERGEPARGRELLEAALEVARARRDAHREAVTLSNLADRASQQGDLARAAELYAQCLEIGRAAEDASAIGMALINLGKVALARGELEAAPARLYEGLAIARQLGSLRGAADTLVALGELAVRQGDVARALERFREAFERYLTSSNYRLAADALEHLAAMFANLKHARAATVVLGAEQAMRNEHRLPKPDRYDDYTQLIDTLRAALGSGRFAECWAVGLALPPLGALEEALGASAMNRGGRRHSRSAPRGPIAQALTARQAQISELVAQGLTNKQISEALDIKQRTVDEHVSAILARLGVASRTAIPANLHSPH